MSDDLKCKIHKIDLECRAGCNAHPDNWYCPECEKEPSVSDDEKPKIDLDAQVERESDALSKLNDIIVEYNDSDDHPDMPPIEEALLFYLATRMAASANGHNGEEHFSRDDILRITKAGINTGKDIIEQGRRDGTLPRPFKLIKPSGMH